MSANVPYIPNRAIISRMPINESEEEEMKLALTKEPSLNNPLTLNMGDNWPIYVGVSIAVIIIVIIIIIACHFYFKNKDKKKSNVNDIF